MVARASIRVQLAVLVAAVALPTFGLLAHALWTGWRAGREQVEQRVAATAQEVAGRLDAVLQRRAALLAKLVERPAVRALDPAHCDPALPEVAAAQPEFIALAVRDRDGVMVCSSRPLSLPAHVVRELPQFRAALEGRFAIGGADAAPVRAAWSVQLTQPVRDDGGRVAGVMLLSIDLLEFQRQVLGHLAGNAVVTVVDADGRNLMLAREPERWIGQPLPPALQARIPADLGRSFEWTGLDGSTYLNAGAVVPASAWRVYVGLPVEPLFAGYRAQVTSSLLISALALLASGWMAWRIGRQITRPVDALEAEIATAQRPLAPDARAGEGANELAAAARHVARLSDERRALQSRHALLAANHAALTRAARDIVLFVDPQGYIVEANQAAVATYGYSEPELLRMHIRELRAPEARASLERDFAAAASPQGVLYETLHLRKDGSPLPVEVSSRVVDIGGGAYRQSFVRDISARKRDEALLRGHNDVLAMIARGAPLAESLGALARLVESQAPGVAAALLLLDDDGLRLRRGAAPSLPGGFAEALDGVPVGLHACACSEAAQRAHPVLAEDIASDARWREWRAAALEHGLRACWSAPILDTRGNVLGTLALYGRQPGRPAPGQQPLIDLATHTAAIAIAAANSTRTLQAQVDELLRWQELVVGREEAMRELKREVNELLGRLGEPARHRAADANP